MPDSSDWYTELPRYNGVHGKAVLSYSDDGERFRVDVYTYQGAGVACRLFKGVGPALNFGRTVAEDPKPFEAKRAEQKRAEVSREAFARVAADVRQAETGPEVAAGVAQVQGPVEQADAGTRQAEVESGPVVLWDEAVSGAPVECEQIGESWWRFTFDGRVFTSTNLPDALTSGRLATLCNLTVDESGDMVGRWFGAPDESTIRWYANRPGVATPLASWMSAVKTEWGRPSLPPMTEEERVYMAAGPQSSAPSKKGSPKETGPKVTRGKGPRVGDIAFKGDPKHGECAELLGQTYQVECLAGEYLVHHIASGEEVCNYVQGRPAMKRAILADVVKRGERTPGALVPVPVPQPEAVPSAELETTEEQPALEYGWERHGQRFAVGDVVRSGHPRAHLHEDTRTTGVVTSVRDRGDGEQIAAVAWGRNPVSYEQWSGTLVHAPVAVLEREEEAEFVARPALPEAEPVDVVDAELVDEESPEESEHQDETANDSVLIQQAVSDGNPRIQGMWWAFCDSEEGICPKPSTGVGGHIIVRGDSPSTGSTCETRQDAVALANWHRDGEAGPYPTDRGGAMAVLPDTVRVEWTACALEHEYQVSCTQCDHVQSLTGPLGSGRTALQRRVEVRDRAIAAALEHAEGHGAEQESAVVVDEVQEQLRQGVEAWQLPVDSKRRTVKVGDLVVQDFFEQTHARVVKRVYRNGNWLAEAVSAQDGSVLSEQTNRLRVVTQVQVDALVRVDVQEAGYRGRIVQALVSNHAGQFRTVCECQNWTEVVEPGRSRTIAWRRTIEEAREVWASHCASHVAAPADTAGVPDDGQADPVAVLIVSKNSTPPRMRVLWRMTRAEAVRLCSDDRTAGRRSMLCWTADPGKEGEDWEFVRDTGSYDAVLAELGITPERTWEQTEPEAAPAVPRAEPSGDAPVVRYSPNSVVVADTAPEVLRWAACHIENVGLHQGQGLFNGPGRTVTLACHPRGAVSVAAGQGRFAAGRTYDHDAIWAAEREALRLLAEHITGQPLARITNQAGVRACYWRPVDEWGVAEGRTAAEVAEMMRAAADAVSAADMAEIPVEAAAGSAVEDSEPADTDENQAEPEPVEDDEEEQLLYHQPGCDGETKWLYVAAEGVARMLRDYLACDCGGVKIGNFHRNAPAMSTGTIRNPKGIREACTADADALADRNSYDRVGPFVVLDEVSKRAPVEWRHAQREIPVVIDPNSTVQQRTRNRDSVQESAAPCGNPSAWRVICGAGEAFRPEVPVGTAAIPTQAAAGSAPQEFELVGTTQNQENKVQENTVREPVKKTLGRRLRQAGPARQRLAGARKKAVRYVRETLPPVAARARATGQQVAKTVRARLQKPARTSVSYRPPVDLNEQQPPAVQTTVPEPVAAALCAAHIARDGSEVDATTTLSLGEREWGLCPEHVDRFAALLDAQSQTLTLGGREWAVWSEHAEEFSALLVGALGEPGEAVADTAEIPDEAAAGHPVEESVEEYQDDEEQAEDETTVEAQEQDGQERPSVMLSGEVPGYDWDEAREALRNAGFDIAGRAKDSTVLILCGVGAEKNATKLRDARERGIPCMDVTEPGRFKDAVCSGEFVGGDPLPEPVKAVHSGLTEREKTDCIRKWGRENGFELKDRGRLPQHVRVAYEEAREQQLQAA